MKSMVLEKKHKSGYEELAVCIVLQAIEDYRYYLDHRKMFNIPFREMTPGVRKKLILLEDAGDFLDSDYAKWFAGVDFNIKDAIDRQYKNSYELEYERIRGIYLKERRK